jgi:hypothetical protein
MQKCTPSFIQQMIDLETLSIKGDVSLIDLFISLSELLKSFLMSPTIIMRNAFKSRSSFSGKFWCPGLAEVGVLGSDDGEWSWFLLVRFLSLPFAIW